MTNYEEEVKTDRQIEKAKLAEWSLQMFDKDGHDPELWRNTVSHAERHRKVK